MSFLSIENYDIVALIIYLTMVMDPFDKLKVDFVLFILTQPHK